MDARNRRLRPRELRTAAELATSQVCEGAHGSACSSDGHSPSRWRSPRCAAQRRNGSPPRARYRGRITDSHGAPIAGARVGLSKAPQLLQTTSDDQGRFAFSALSPRIVRVERFGHRVSPGGLSWRASRSILGIASLSQTLTSSCAGLRVSRGSVHDERGAPIERAAVRLVPLELVGGRLHFSSGASPSTVSDGLGQFRFAGVSPGTYLVLTPSAAG